MHWPNHMINRIATDACNRLINDGQHGTDRHIERINSIPENSQWEQCNYASLLSNSVQIWYPCDSMHLAFVMLHGGRLTGYIYLCGEWIGCGICVDINLSVFLLIIWRAWHWLVQLIKSIWSIKGEKITTNRKKKCNLLPIHRTCLWINKKFQTLIILIKALLKHQKIKGKIKLNRL